MTQDRPQAERAPHAWIGTSGWSYDHWAGVFYPEHLGAAKRLSFYASALDTVEVDGTFYRLQSEEAVARWRDEVPDGFRFAVKGSRFITHFRRLEGVDEQVAAFLRRMSVLGDKLAVVLWQLPPRLHLDLELLGAFLALLPDDGVRHAIEFRDESWLAEEVFALLGEHGVAQVHVSSDEMPVELTPTADFVYVRFHDTAEYHGAYEVPALAPWCEFVSRQLVEGRDAYAYFNNDAGGHAPLDAARFAEMLARKVCV